MVTAGIIAVAKENNEKYIMLIFIQRKNPTVRYL